MQVIPMTFYLTVNAMAYILDSGWQWAGRKMLTIFE
jgi:hypothetical protein